MKSLIFTIDLAHPPRHPDVVEEELLRAITSVKNSLSLRVLKIVHGHGSSGKGGTTKTIVRNWLFRQRGRLREVIEGESYDMFCPEVQEMRKEVGDYRDEDLGAKNPGITIVWVK